VLTVIKCGGGAGQDPTHISPDVAALTARGDRVLVLHGGSDQVDRLADRLGVRQRRLRTPSGTSSRYTDPATLEVLLLALAGIVKPRLLADLHRHGVTAIGLTGIDAGVLRARRRSVHRAEVDGRTVVVRDDQTGTLTSVHTGPLYALMSAGLVPVLSPPALAEDGSPVNVDADRAAAAVAAALGADNLIFLTGAPGLLADPADETTVLPEYLLQDGGARIAGGMAVKLKAAESALAAGVPRVLIADGRVAQPVLRGLDGAGTRVRLGVPAAVEAVSPVSAVPISVVPATADTVTRRSTTAADTVRSAG
jgi:acetylglutamate/LysW-gamma-L-alpha-aminoadipate kinase